MSPNLSAPFALKATLYSMLVGSSLVLTACGGGGGGSDSSPTPTPVDDGKATLQATVKDAAAFAQYDSDSSGGITLAEALKASAKLTQAAFDSLDTSKDGKLSVAELGISIVVDDGKATLKATVKDEASLAQYDADKDGSLTLAEALKASAKLTQAAFDSLDTAPKDSKLSKAELGITVVTPTGVTVTFKKPDAWGANISMYCWGSTPASACPTKAWPGYLTTLANGLYSYTFPAGTTFSNVIFSDCVVGGPNCDNTKTVDLVFKPADGICYNGISASWSLSADCAAAAKVAVNRPAGDFKTSQLNLVLSTNEDVGYYTLDGSDPTSASNVNRKSFKNDDIVVVGAGLAIDASQTLKLASKAGTITKDYAYTKRVNPVGSGCYDTPSAIANPDTLSAERKAKFQDIRMYQVMVEAFQDGDQNVGYANAYGSSSHKGDLRGIINALDYIKSLNVNAIWLTPVFDSDDAGGGDSKLNATGYFAKNYFDIDPKFGSKAVLKELVNAAHDRGMYVFLDGVFGHHKTGDVPASPCGNQVAGNSDPVSYPGSLEFYKEVAAYWVREAGIDGWRLDQAYQVPANYLTEIRHAVEAVSAQRAQANEQWGTLGYMVGEVWKDGPSIASQAYGPAEKPALYSAFDFPTRYSITQILASQEDASVAYAKNQPADKLNGTYGFAGHASVYPAHAVPNLFLTNHDVVRFGDLLQRGAISSPDKADYWERHKAALSLLAAYSGPVTLYYGDEIGDEVADFAAQLPSNSCSAVGKCDDHVSRSTGNINEANFNANQKALKAYVAALFKLKADNKALSQGTRTNLVANVNLLADLKKTDNQQIVYVLNKDVAAQTLSLTQEQLGTGKNLYLMDVLTGLASATPAGLTPSIPALSGQFYLVK